jgi:gas vesicle protein
MADRRIYYSEEAAHLARRNRTIGLLAALGLGLALGAALGMVLSPEKGAKLRDNLLSSAASGLKRGRKLSSKTLKQVDLGKVRDVGKLLPIGR